jgi:uncharacterized protein (TIGR03086 family)
LISVTLDMIDLEPATRTLTNLIHRVRDNQLDDPTPCHGISLGDLIDHVESFAVAFTAAATKTSPPDGSPAPPPDSSRLGRDWRVRIAKRLAALAQAWDQPESWTGMTQAGGQALPGEMAGVIALDEVIVHSWDIAVTIEQPFACKPELVAAALGFVGPVVEQNPAGTPGLFGPPAHAPDGASELDRLIALTGRRPGWTPTGLPA